MVSLFLRLVWLNMECLINFHRLLGGGRSRAQCVNAVQVRVVSSMLGAFKGMLVVKPGIEKN